eukprot:TRINITY_DN2649_c0_g1_i1.p1 TRINITY_DN2649_c0_g1~~TRINITY_DN2649_c0_g1_i1.p1  ORF type:complete len:417 (-),score=128.51 TRINITY_DN2649_c0_g1_i1:22-1272(-)
MEQPARSASVAKQHAAHTRRRKRTAEDVMAAPAPTVVAVVATAPTPELASGSESAGGSDSEAVGAEGAAAVGSGSESGSGSGSGSESGSGSGSASASGSGSGSGSGSESGSDAEGSYSSSESGSGSEIGGDKGKKAKTPSTEDPVMPTSAPPSPEDGAPLDLQHAAVAAVSALASPSTAQQEQFAEAPASELKLTPPPFVAAEYTARDEKAKMEEEQGVLSFDLIGNDGDRNNVERLVHLKNIFQKQLPNMPREYLVRIVFDMFNHRSLLIQKNKKVIGGICFRTFRDRGFIEIVFCAVMSSEQVKGYGSHMMNHLKEAMRQEGLLYFLTYSDNFAIPYFQKQGFTKEVTLPLEWWKGYIKDYDGATLMECVLNANVTNYTDIPSMIRIQREVLIIIFSSVNSFRRLLKICVLTSG